MNPLALITSVLPSAIKVAGKALGLSGPAEALANAISGASPEQTAQMSKDLAALKLEELKVDAQILDSDNKVEIAEVQSTDKYVSRARPTGLYIGYAIIALLAVAMVVQSFRLNVPIPVDGVLSLVVPCLGHASYYAYSRTKEKIAKVA